ncbi:hypothetical protein LCGC14_1458980, partial [marine sediment metagenome]
MNITREQFFRKTCWTPPIKPIGKDFYITYILARFKIFPKTTPPFFSNAYWPIMTESSRVERVRKKIAKNEIYNFCNLHLKINKRKGIPRKRGRFIIIKLKQQDVKEKDNV